MDSCYQQYIICCYLEIVLLQTAVIAWLVNSKPGGVGGGGGGGGCDLYLSSFIVACDAGLGVN